MVEPQIFRRGRVLYAKGAGPDGKRFERSTGVRLTTRAAEKAERARARDVALSWSEPSAPPSTAPQSSSPLEPSPPASSSQPPPPPATSLGSDDDDAGTPDELDDDTREAFAAAAAAVAATEEPNDDTDGADEPKPDDDAAEVERVERQLLGDEELTADERDLYANLAGVGVAAGHWKGLRLLADRFGRVGPPPTIKLAGSDRTINLLDVEAGAFRRCASRLLANLRVGPWGAALGIVAVTSVTFVLTMKKKEASGEAGKRAQAPEAAAQHPSPKPPAEAEPSPFPPAVPPSV